NPVLRLHQTSLCPPSENNRIQIHIRTGRNVIVKLDVSVRPDIYERENGGVPVGYKPPRNISGWPVTRRDHRPSGPCRISGPRDSSYPPKCYITRRQQLIGWRVRCAVNIVPARNPG